MMNSTHDSKCSIKTTDSTSQKTSKDAASSSSTSSSSPSLSVDSKYSIQVDDKDRAIHIDTDLVKRYRHELKNMVDKLEEKSMLGLWSFLKTHENGKKLLSNLPFIFAKRKNIEINAMQEEIISNLRFQKKELDESILLLKKRIKMRTKYGSYIRLSSMAIMTLSAILMASRYYSLKDLYGRTNTPLYMDEHLRSILRPTIGSNFYNHMYNVSSHNHIYCGENDRGGILTYCIPRTLFNIEIIRKCNSPYMPFDFNKHSATYGDCGLTWWCVAIHRERSIKRFHLNFFNDFIEESIMGNFSELNFFLMFLAFGEFAPLIIILGTLLRNIFYNSDSSFIRNNSIVDRVFNRIDLDRAEYRQVLHTANRYNIYWRSYTYRMLQNDLEHESKKIAVHLDLFNKAENMRMAFLSGMCEKDTQKTPIRKLFYSANSNNLLMGEPRVIAKIFAFAGISMDQLSKSFNKKAQRTAFESGAHSKNNVVLRYPNNALKPYPLFKFFNRLNTEQAGLPLRLINLNQHPFFQKLINLKKFTERDGKAHDKRKILRNIYEFAGLIPKSMPITSGINYR